MEEKSDGRLRRDDGRKHQGALQGNKYGLIERDRKKKRQSRKKVGEKRDVGTH